MPPTPQRGCCARSRAQFEIDGKQVFPRASIGICLAEPGAATTEAEELLRNADVAMYMAKRDCKGSYRIFEPTMHERVLERLELRSDLQRAIEDEPARGALPADRPPQARRDLRCRGAAALAASDPRHHPAGSVHPARRGDGPDHPDRALGAPGGVPRRRAHARAVPARRAADDQRQPLRAAAAVGDDRRRRTRGARDERATCHRRSCSRSPSR